MSSSNIVLAGANGFLNRHLRQHFQTLGYEVVGVSRTGADVVRCARSAREYERQQEPPR